MLVEKKKLVFATRLQFEPGDKTRYDIEFSQTEFERYNNVIAFSVINSAGAIASDYSLHSFKSFWIDVGKLPMEEQLGHWVIGDLSTCIRHTVNPWTLRAIAHAANILLIDGDIHIINP